jgi:signal transduction histidine kinase
VRPSTDTLAARIAAGFILMALSAIALFSVLILVLVDRDLNAAAHRQLRSNVAALTTALQTAFNEDHSWTKADFAPVIALAHAYGIQLDMQAQSKAVLAITAKAADGPTANFDVISNGQVVAHVSLRQPSNGLTPAQAGLRHTITTSITLTALVTIALATASGVLLASRLARPLHQLASAARRLGKGARTNRVDPIRGPREVRDLAAAFDSMAADLQRQDQLRRGLTANVAHELRTPLSILQAQTVALSEGIIDWTPEVAGSFAEEVGRLSRLVEDLGTLAAAEAASLNLTRDPLRLDHVAIDTVERLRHRLDQRNITLRLDLSPTVIVGDVDRIEQIVTNLVSNAARYTQTGGTVRMIVGSCAGWATLTVSDSGPGIPEAERVRVFERFARGSSAAGVPGTGIGLAVVRELVAAHGGTVTLDASPEGGSRFTVSVPAPSAEYTSESSFTGSTQQPDQVSTPAVSNSHMTPLAPSDKPSRDIGPVGSQAPKGGDPHGQDPPRVLPPRP